MDFILKISNEWIIMNRIIKLSFIISLVSLLIEVQKNVVKSFYNMPEFLKWKESVNPDLWYTKYYKGLGTSNALKPKIFYRY